MMHDWCLEKQQGHRQSDKRYEEKWEEKQMKNKVILKQCPPWPNQRLKTGNDNDSTPEFLQTCDKK